MQYVAHHARLDRPLDDGTTRRANLEMGARNGSTYAINALMGPPMPDAFGGLFGWATELLGRSGAGLEGAAPLTYTTIMHWAALTGRSPAPHEVTALLRLDAVMRNPGDDAPSDKQSATAPATPAWPTRKAEAM